ncbi:MAG TPA: hypothetical protein VEI02_08690 [Planctomycetota bacterium]|nr:hypothetical protein [Planctomycetota bacterium]
MPAVPLDPTEASLDDLSEPPPRGALGRAYDRLFRGAQSGRGRVALGALAALEAFGVPIPPDPCLWLLAAGSPRRTGRFAATALVASMLGTAGAYVAGPALWERYGGWANRNLAAVGYSDDAFRVVRDDARHTGVFWQALAEGLQPTGGHRCALVAGLYRRDAPPASFFIASFLARAIRFFVFAGAAAFFAELVRDAARRRPWPFTGALAAAVAAMIAVGLLRY